MIALRDTPWVRRTLIGVTLAFLGLFVVIPIVAVFVEAFSKGLGSYVEATGAPAEASLAGRSGRLARLLGVQR